MKILFPLFAALVALLLYVEPASTAIAGEPLQEEAGVELEFYESTHYRLGTNIDADTSQTYSKMIEAMWPQLVEFFGEEPRLKKDEKLTVFFLASREDWRAKLTEDGVAIPVGAGGYYWPGNKCVYLFRQPTIYNSRQLLLHECMHQFHFLACCGNTGPKDTWYTEGIVEHLSRHYWDGEKLTLGVIPFCSLADYPKLALDLYERDDYDLESMITSERASGRPEQWALVRFLLLAEEGKYAKNWRKLAKKLDAGQNARSTFKRYLGEPKQLQPKIHEWLKTQQEPFVPVWNEWIGLGANAVEGTAGVTSACRTRADATEIAATLHVPEGDWKGGLLIGFKDVQEYTVALLKSDGSFSVNKRTEGRWEVLKRSQAPEPAEGTYRLQAKRGEAGITLTANEIELGTFDLPGMKLGVCLENCTLRFSDIEWK